MRATEISIISPAMTEPISFSLRDPDPTARFMVRNVTGVDADEITRKYIATGIASKNRMYEPVLKPRDIVIFMSLHPRFEIGESYSDVRDDVYRLVSPTRAGEITIRFHDGGAVNAAIKGFVSKIEVATFTDKPAVQITVHCVDPIFRSTNPFLMTGNDLGVLEKFQVPDADSTAPHGFSFKVTFNANVTNFTIQDDSATPDWKFKVVYPFLGGDQLYFSNSPGEKYLYRIRTGVTLHLVDKIDPGSIWPMLQPGEVNDLYIDEITDGHTFFNWNELKFYPAYLGV